MLYAQMGNQRGLGATLVEGTNYKCGTKICYGADGGKTDAVFKQLQTYANQVAQLYGLQQIAVDGFIGGATITLIRQIAARVPSATGALAQAQAAFSKEVAAENAPELLSQLQALLVARPVAVPATAQATPGTLTPTTTNPAQAGASPMTTAAGQIVTPSPTVIDTTGLVPAAVPQPKTKVGLIVGVIGGIAVLGTIIAVVAVKRSSKQYQGD